MRLCQQMFPYPSVYTYIFNGAEGISYMPSNTVHLFVYFVEGDFQGDERVLQQLVATRSLGQAVEANHGLGGSKAQQRDRLRLNRLTVGQCRNTAAIGGRPTLGRR